MLVLVRPSNEALPRARVPGAQDQPGCPSNLVLSFFPTSLSRGVARLSFTARIDRTIYMLPPSLLVFSQEGAGLASHCARPTRAF